MRLAIDYGRARVGIAIGSRLARELTTLPNDARLVEQITEIIDKEDISEIVLGEPIRSEGEPGTLRDELVVFKEQLLKACPSVKIETVDEAFSTTQAEIELKEQGVSSNQLKQRIDQYAAKIILDQFNSEHP